jgi:hypothetical protein
MNDEYYIITMYGAKNIKKLVKERVELCLYLLSVPA